MPEQPITVIGFDYGTRWIGIAVGQTQTGSASPLQAVPVINNKPDWDRIEQLINTWQPQLLLVGRPDSMIGETSPMTPRAERFKRQLEGRFQLPAQLVDERLTTREAWQIAEHSDKHMSKQQLDCIAAVLITETWLHEKSAVQDLSPQDQSGDEK